MWIITLSNGSSLTNVRTQILSQCFPQHEGENSDELYLMFEQKLVLPDSHLFKKKLGVELEVYVDLRERN